MKLCLAAALSVAALAACKRPAPVVFKPPAPAPAAPAEGATGTEAAAGDADANPRVPTDLPPFGAAAGADPAKAADLLAEIESQVMEGGGYDQFEPGDDSWNQVVLAVKTDPGSPQARVAVARMVGDDAFTVAQLTPLLTAKDCADCADALLNLDAESWPAVASVVELVSASPQRQAVDALRTYVAEGDKASVAALFSGKKITIVTSCLSCELSGLGGDPKPRKVTGPKALTFLAGLRGDDNLYAMGEWYCSNDCCSAREGFYGTPNGHTYLSSVCFAPGTTTITELTVID